METINDRMEILVKQRFDGNKAQFAKAIGLTPTSISSYLGNKRRSKPSVDMVAKIVQVLHISANWLITGVGDMYGNGQQHHNVYVNSDGAHLVQVANGDNNNQEISPEELKQENDALKRENEALKKDIGNLEQRIAEKDEEIKFLRSLLAK